MALFVDTSDPKEIKELFTWGVLAGVTTNPLILARESPGCDLGERIRQILAASEGDVSVELTAETERGMIEEALRYHAWDPQRIVIKIPFGGLGLAVNRDLRKRGVKTNMTCIMATNQAYLAVLGEATYVSIFSGRVRDMGYDVRPVIAQTRMLIDREGSSSQIIVGSVRHMMDVVEALDAGAHVPTVTPSVLRKMLWNPRTEETIQEFAEAWHKHESTLPTAIARVA